MFMDMLMLAEGTLNVEVASESLRLMEAIQRGQFILLLSDSVTAASAKPVRNVHVK